MKKFMIVLLVTFMSLSLFACGGKDTNQPNSPTPEGNNTEEPSDPPAQEKADEDEPDKDKADKDEDIDNPDDDPEETNPTDNSGNINPTNKPVDIDTVTSSKEAPAKVGQWQETKRYSAVDREYHTIYYRITDIIRYNDEVQSALDAWNDADHLRVFDPLESDDLEYCLIKYEANFPEEFPQHDWGITSVDVGFSVASPTGGGIKANGMAYIGLSTVYDISDSIEINEFYAGQTYSEGLAVFVMVKDVSDYIVESYYFENDERVSTFVEGK